MHIPTLYLQTLKDGNDSCNLCVDCIVEWPTKKILAKHLSHDELLATLHSRSSALV
jgi:hypothetical protein